MRAAVIGAVLALTGGSAVAAPSELMERVESPVYEMTGAPQELAGRAAVCFGQILRSGLTTAPTILAQDIEGGQVVARSTFLHTERMWGSDSTYDARSRLTFEAREGRFRLVHTDIELLALGSWRTPRTPKPGKRDEMREELLAIADKVAVCVKAAPAEW